MSEQSSRLRTPGAFGPTEFRRALGCFPTGVTIITTRGLEGEPLGMTVSSFNSVSLSPPLVLWSLALSSSSRAAVEAASHYAIHILAADQAGIARQFAMPGRGADRFAGVPWRPNEHGVPILQGDYAARFECVGRSQYVAGDHIILVGEVEHCEHTAALPLVFHAGGFHLTPDIDGA